MACASAGSQYQWATNHKLSSPYVSDVLVGRRDPGPSILKAIGLKKLVVYVHAMFVLMVFSTTVHATTVCLDRDEFSGLIQRVERLSKELANTTAQVSLYKQANAMRKEEIRIHDDYVRVLEERLALADELEAGIAQREQEAAASVDRAHWWKNLGWGTAALMTVIAITIGVLK